MYKKPKAKFVRLEIYIYVCVCVCVYIYVYVYIYIYHQSSGDMEVMVFNIFGLNF